MGIARHDPVTLELLKDAQRGVVMTPFSLPPKACHHGDCDQCGVKLLAPQGPVDTGKHSRKLGQGKIGEIDCTAHCPVLPYDRLHQRSARPARPGDPAAADPAFGPPSCRWARPRISAGWPN